LGDEIKTASSLRDGAPIGLRRYSSDYEAARLLEGAIERLGRQIGYVMALMRMLDTRQMGGMDEKWALIRATPEQRARAFVEVVRANDGA